MKSSLYALNTIEIAHPNCFNNNYYNNFITKIKLI